MYPLKEINTSPAGNTNGEQARTFDMDGGADFRYHFSLSGETQAPQVIVQENGPQLSASEVAALNITKREYQKEYMDYWNSTANLTGTGRPVDGFFCPLAPHAAVIPTQYENVGYTSFVNVLDYSSISIPVTFADKTIDVQGKDPSLSADYINWNCASFPASPVVMSLTPF
jgi:amidase